MIDFWAGFIFALVLCYFWYQGTKEAEYKRKRAEEQGIDPENLGI